MVDIHGLSYIVATHVLVYLNFYINWTFPVNGRPLLKFFEQKERNDFLLGRLL